MINPSAEDLADLEAKRAWVRDHYQPEARQQYDTIEGKLTLLDTILRNEWIEQSETLKLQCLGIAFGDALLQKLDLRWVTVEDEYGRDPALELDGTSIKLFPQTMLSKRIEDGETVDVRDLFEGVCQKVSKVRAGLSS